MIVINVAYDPNKSQFDHMEVFKFTVLCRDNITAEELFQELLPGRDPNDFCFRLNRGMLRGYTRLRDNDIFDIKHSFICANPGC